MSQQQFFGTSGGGSFTGIEFVTGNDGTPTPGDATTHVLTFLGDNASGLNVLQTGPSQETVFGLSATTGQRGTIILSTNAQALAGTDTTTAMTPQDVQVKVGTQTLNGLAYGGGATAAIEWTAAMTNGEVLIGSTGNPPVPAQFTSSNNSITWTFGAGTIDAIVTDFFVGTGTTIGAVTANLITLPLGAVAGTFQFEARVKGYESTGPNATGYNLYATLITDGTTATLIGNQNVFNESSALETSDAYFIASGNNAVLQVLGVATFTINWSAEAEIT